MGFSLRDLSRFLKDAARRGSFLGFPQVHPAVPTASGAQLPKLVRFRAKVPTRMLPIDSSQVKDLKRVFEESPQATVPNEVTKPDIRNERHVSR